MLVLSRSKDESVVIGPDLVVTIEEIRADKVRVAICGSGSMNVTDKDGGTVKTAARGESIVVSRRKGEALRIGEDIELTIYDIRGDKMRLGIQCPGKLAVHRQEVYEAIMRENRRSKDAGDTAP